MRVFSGHRKGREKKSRERRRRERPSTKAPSAVAFQPGRVVDY